MLLPEPPSEHARRNLVALRSAGADLRFGGRGEAARALAEHRRADGRRAPPTYVIPMGGTDALGSVGFVAAGFELAAQVEAGSLPEPDVVVMALGTGGSAVGLAIGLRAAGLRSRVLAVRASSPGTSSPQKLLEVRRETLALLRRHAPSFPALDERTLDLRIESHQLGRGYAFPTSSGEAAQGLAARTEGLQLEPTYTAKALAAVVAAAPAYRQATVVFWHSADAGGE